MVKDRAYQIVLLAMIAALYTALSLVLAPFSFGNIQVRIAEALTLLPIILPSSVWAITLGCFLTNLIGVLTGVNILGILDVIVGTLVTLIAALLTKKLAKYRYNSYPFISTIPPIILNALVIGLELTFVLNPLKNFSLPFFILMFVEVFMGQFISIFILGLPLIHQLEKKEILKGIRKNS